MFRWEKSSIISECNKRGLHYSPIIRKARTTANEQLQCFILVVIFKNLFISFQKSPSVTKGIVWCKHLSNLQLADPPGFSNICVSGETMDRIYISQVEVKRKAENSSPSLSASPLLARSRVLSLSLKNKLQKYKKNKNRTMCCFYC